MKRSRLKFSDYYYKMFLGSRKKNVIFAKRMFIYILRKMFGLTLMEIAEVTNLHHSSIIHHTRKFEFFYNNYTEENDAFERVENKIIEVEVDEMIEGLEAKKEKIVVSLYKLNKIKNQKNDRQKREGLLTK